MNLQDLIDSKRFIESEILLSLTTLLTYKQKQEDRLAIKSAISNRFYTIFDGTDLAKRFRVEGNVVEFLASSPKARSSELKRARVIILNS